MQPPNTPGQPFGQPGQPPEAPPPYAAPPRRKPTFLFACLGCLGITFVVVGLLVGAAFLRLNKAAGPSITAAQVPSVLPAGVPLHPALQLNEPLTRGMRFGGAFLKMIPEAQGAEMRMMAFNSSEPLSVIGPWYVQRLQAQGWKGGASSDGKNYQFRKGADMLVLTQNPGQASSAVIMVVGKNLEQMKQLKPAPPKRSGS